MRTQIKQLRVLDLFSGIGGFSLGLERAGMQTVAFCEIDKTAQQVLRKHWSDVPIFDDVKTLKGEQLGTIDVICGGFPCQDLSFAGKGAGLTGARSGLWWEFHRLIKEIQPSWVIIENVAALRSRGLDKVLGSLAEIGYDAQWHCIPASAIGAHHQRDRVWIIAYPNYTRSRTPEHGVDQDGQTLEQERQDQPLGGVSGRSENVADSRNARLQGGEWIRNHFEEARRRQTSADGAATERCSVSGRTIHPWHSEPNVGRVADGVSGRVDRLKQLGNAVVPQIPELIGRAINAIA